MNAMLETREPAARYLHANRGDLLRHIELLVSVPDGVARLRKLILRLAVEGRLTSRQSNDEPVEVLLAQLRTQGFGCDRDQLVVDANDVPCALPATWQWVRLTNLGEFRGGKTPSTQNRDFWGGTIPWITPKDMKQLRLCDSQDHVTSAALKDGLSLIPSHSVLMVVRSGILRRTVPTAINEVETTINQDLKALVPALPDLAAYVQLLIRGFEEYILQNLTKVGTTVESIQFEAFAAQLFPLPSRTEQHRIITVVGELMHLCDALEANGRLEAEQHARLLDVLLGSLISSTNPDELATNWQRVAAHFDLLLDRPEAVEVVEEVIVELAIHGVLAPQRADEGDARTLLEAIRAQAIDLAANRKGKPSTAKGSHSDAAPRFHVPPTWTWARLEELAIAVVDCPHSTPKFLGTGLLCIDTNSFKGGKLLLQKLRFVDQSTFEERTERLRPLPGDLVFAREGSVGESLIIPPGTVACLGQRVMLFRFSRLVSTEFIQLAISSREFLDMLLSLHKGIGAKHVNVGDMRRAAIPLPPLAEQLRIVARVGQLRRLCSDLREKLTTARELQTRLAEALVQEAGQAPA